MSDDQIPPDLVEWIEATTAGEVTELRRVPGGASREAWFVDVRTEAGVDELFLRYGRQPDRHGTS